MNFPLLLFLQVHNSGLSYGKTERRGGTLRESGFYTEGVGVAMHLVIAGLILYLFRQLPILIHYKLELLCQNELWLVN